MIPKDVLACIPPVVRPNVTNCGFALFMASNAAIVMGGVLPFLPIQYQSSENMFLYYLTESLMFGLSFFVAATFSYFSPKSTNAIMAVSAVSYFCGCFGTIFVMYYAQNAIPLFVASGVLLGIGSAGFHILWQRILAAQDFEEGTHNLILGTIFSAVLYFAFYLIPIAVTHLLIPVALLPLFLLCMVLASRKCSFDQPMFQDKPREYSHVYQNTTKDYWHSAVCIGAIGLASGVIRSIAISEPSIGIEVNASALAGSFLAASILLILWQRKSVNFRVTSAFRVVYPIIIVGFVLVAFLNGQFLRLFSAGMYMMYSLSTMVMMMQCAQSSRNRGVHPVVVYGCFGGIVYAMHDLGFVSGYSAELLKSFGFQPLWAAALVTVALLALVYYLGGNEVLPSAMPRGHRRRVDGIELAPSYAMAMRQRAKVQNAEDKGSLAGERSDLAEAPVLDPLEPREPSERPPFAEQAYQDKLSKQCTIIQGRYGLSSRETEVMEYLARGFSMRAVGEELIVSENTIRTHAKRIYTKLGIHKRIDLRDLIESADPKIDR